MYWNHWSIDRILILFVSLAFILLGIQVTLFHYRQNFHHKSMWVPVILAPIFFISGMVLTWYNAGWLHLLFNVFMWLGLVSGLIGFYFHVRGVGIRVGGLGNAQFSDRPTGYSSLVFHSAECFGTDCFELEGDIEP